MESKYNIKKSQRLINEYTEKLGLINKFNYDKCNRYIFDYFSYYLIVLCDIKNRITDEIVSEYY